MSRDPDVVWVPAARRHTCDGIVGHAALMWWVGPYAAKGTVMRCQCGQTWVNSATLSRNLWRRESTARRLFRWMTARGQ